MKTRFFAEGPLNACHTISPKGEFECLEPRPLHPFRVTLALPFYIQNMLNRSTKRPPHMM
jgi:hypothetical protein